MITNRKSLLTLFFIALLAGIIFFLVINFFTSMPSPWQVREHSVEFMPIWARETTTNVRRSAHDEAEMVFFILTDHDLVFYEGESLKRVNLFTKEVQWQQNIKRPSAITNNEWYIYTANTARTATYASDNSLIMPGSIQVTAFDMATGEIIWSSTYEGFEFVSHMAANEHEVGISGDNGHGAFPDEINIAARTGLPWGKKFDGLGISRQFFTRLSGEVVYYDHLGETDDGKFIVTLGDKVYALDPSTDVILWEKNIAAVTNLAISQGIIFLLDRDGILWALDKQTGVPIGSIHFEPANPDKAEPLANYGIPRYSVLANEEVVVLHFQNTQQLFVFRFLRMISD